MGVCADRLPSIINVLVDRHERLLKAKVILLIYVSDVTGDGLAMTYPGITSHELSGHQTANLVGSGCVDVGDDAAELLPNRCIIVYYSSLRVTLRRR